METQLQNTQDYFSANMQDMTAQQTPDAETYNHDQSASAKQQNMFGLGNDVDEPVQLRQANKGLNESIDSSSITNTKGEHAEKEEQNKKDKQSVIQHITLQVLDQQISELRGQIAQLDIKIDKQEKIVVQANKDLQSKMAEGIETSDNIDQSRENTEGLKKKLETAKAAGDNEEVSRLTKALKVNESQHDQDMEKGLDAASAGEKSLDNKFKQDEKLDGLNKELKDATTKLEETLEEKETLENNNNEPTKTASPTAAGKDGQGIEPSLTSKNNFNQAADGQTANATPAPTVAPTVAPAVAPTAPTV